MMFSLICCDQCKKVLCVCACVRACARARVVFIYIYIQIINFIQYCLYFRSASKVKQTKRLLDSDSEPPLDIL